MSGKVLIEWKHRLCSDLSRQRYMDPDITRSVHIEIANIFFNQEQDDSDEISSEHNSAGKYLQKKVSLYISNMNNFRLFAKMFQFEKKQADLMVNKLCLILTSCITSSGLQSEQKKNLFFLTRLKCVTQHAGRLKIPKKMSHQN